MTKTRNRFSAALVAASITAIMLSGARTEASPITYSVDIPLPIGWSGAPTGGEVTGSITTDGTIGPLSISDILSWNLTITWNLTTGPASAVLTATTSTVSDKYISGPCGYVGLTLTCYQGAPVPLSATASSLAFDFSVNPSLQPGNGGILRFGGDGAAVAAVVFTEATICSTNPFHTCGVNGGSIFASNYPNGTILAPEAFYSLQVIGTVSVPAPIVGAGLPGLLVMLGIGGFYWKRRTAVG